MARADRPARRPHYPALDGLRGLGILTVLLGHARLIYLVEMEPAASWEHWMLQIADFNWIAMEWFFVMSGFLITKILLDAKPHPHFFRNFYARRFLRIFPIYYGFLAFYFFLLPRLMDLRANAESAYAFAAEHQAWYWTYMANFLIARHGDWPGEMSHFWSLSIEEHFYAVWPLLVFFLRRRPLIIVTVAAIVASVALRAYLTWQGAAPIAVYVMTITHIDSILMGSMLSVLVGGGESDLSPLVRIRRPLTRLTLIFLPIMLWFYVQESHFTVTGAALQAQPQAKLYPAVAIYGWLMAAVGSCALVVWLLTGPERHWIVRLFRLPFFRWLGTYSYGMYVIHLMVFGLFHQSSWSMVALSETLGSRALGVIVGFTLPLLVTFGLAWLLWHGYEKHFLRLKKHFVVR